MKVREIVLAAIPNADESVIDHVLWGRTPFPCGAITAKSLYKAAYQYKRAADSKIRLCDFCSRRAEPNKWLCGKCSRMLDGIRDENETK